MPVALEILRNVRNFIIMYLEKYRIYFTISTHSELNIYFFIILKLKISSNIPNKYCFFELNILIEIEKVMNKTRANFTSLMLLKKQNIFINLYILC